MAVYCSCEAQEARAGFLLRALKLSLYNATAGNAGSTRGFREPMSKVFRQPDGEYITHYCQCNAEMALIT